jgi:hypothetical protein
MFSSNGAGAFSISLPNGYDVSVAFGSGNYCSNRDKPVRPDASGTVWSPNAEIAVFKTGTREVVDLDAAEFDALFRGLRIGSTLSWVRPAHFVQLIAVVAELPDWRTEEDEPPLPPADVAGCRPQAGEASPC